MLADSFPFALRLRGLTLLNFKLFFEVEKRQASEPKRLDASEL